MKAGRGDPISCGAEQFDQIMRVLEIKGGGSL